MPVLDYESVGGESEEILQSHRESGQEEDHGKEIQYDKIAQLRKDKDKLDRFQIIISIILIIFGIIPGLILIVIGLVIIWKSWLSSMIIIGVGAALFLISIFTCATMAIFRRIYHGDHKFYLFLAGERKLDFQEGNIDEIEVVVVE